MKPADWQRLRNLALFKAWVTDEEMAYVFPIFLLLTFVVIVVGAVWSLWF